MIKQVQKNEITQSDVCFISLSMKIRLLSYTKIGGQIKHNSQRNGEHLGYMPNWELRHELRNSYHS
jgi:hypothetical protein